MSNLSLRDRFVGTLLGVHTGDSLGAPYETQSRAKIVADIRRRGGLQMLSYQDPFEPWLTWPKGRPTDDTEMTAATAAGLLAEKPLDCNHHYALFRRIAHEQRSMLWNEKAVGFGRTTKAMLWEHDYLAAQARYLPPRIASNGSLMRSSPIALRFYREPALRRHAAQELSKITHLNPIAGECCVLYTTILAEALWGKKTPQEMIEFAFRFHAGDIFTPEVRSLQERIFREPEPPTPQGRGHAVYSLHAACWAFAHSRSFTQGITRVIALGGDTDTYGAIAGGLLGAHFGFEAIPQAWRYELLGGGELVNLAYRLHDAAVP